MECSATRIPYRQTNFFSRIVLDYIDQYPELTPFFVHPPGIQGLKNSIAARENKPVNRHILVSELKKQYEGLPAHPVVQENLDALLSPGTFTITTAHQNNLFTGPLYFIYKILHVIRLAAYCRETFPEYRFVPVFYMGSEDADLDELNHIFLSGEKLQWNTSQTGAVGRMKIDKELIKLIDRMEGQLRVQPFGDALIRLLRDCYREGDTVQLATFRIIHALFADYGLIVLIPDNAALKAQMINLFKDDLLHQTASGIVQATAQRLQNAGYKVQANPREINLFYLHENLRNRIEYKNSRYVVLQTNLEFSPQELEEELRNHPERFSPNVILRGLYQETLLPNIVFVGGGGEIAYWLQLKDLFDHYKIPYPMLVLRNSFLLVEKKWQDKLNRLGFAAEDFFQDEQTLINRLVARESKKALRLNGSLTELVQLYEQFKKQATAVDESLEKHVEVLKQKAVQQLQVLEKKMWRAEKRKFADQQRQVHTLKENLFPQNNLQERMENFSYYYAKWGAAFIQLLYRHSLQLEQEFVVVQEK